MRKKSAKVDIYGSQHGRRGKIYTGRNTSGAVMSQVRFLRYAHGDFSGMHKGIFTVILYNIVIL